MTVHHHRDIVRVHTDGTYFDIDFNANVENGELDMDMNMADDYGYNSRDMISAIHEAIRKRIALTDRDGNLVLLFGSVTAYTVLSEQPS